MTTALITGASTGLGAEYARQLAAHGLDLVLVARTEPTLESLAQQLRTAHGIEVEVLPADLLEPDGLDRVTARVSDPERPVDWLVNNAGFGLSLAFERNPVQTEVDHLRIHNEVPLRLTHAALAGMLARGNGHILNIASVAAYLPRSTYSASKRWLVEFSRWANAKYRPRGVTVTAVCPGFTHTEFHARLGLAKGEEGIPGILWLEADDVVRESLRDVAGGRGISVPSVRYKVIVALLKVLPGLVHRACRVRRPLSATRPGRSARSGRRRRRGLPGRRCCS